MRPLAMEQAAGAGAGRGICARQRPGRAWRRARDTGHAHATRGHRPAGARLPAARIARTCAALTYGLGAHAALLLLVQWGGAAAAALARPRRASGEAATRSCCGSVYYVPSHAGLSPGPRAVLLRPARASLARDCDCDQQICKPSICLRCDGSPSTQLSVPKYQSFSFFEKQI